MNTSIPQTSPGLGYLAHRDEIDQAVREVMAGGVYVLGRAVAGFEDRFAAHAGATFGVGVASGTDALCLALKGCGVRPGDEVVTVSHTAVATVAAIEMAGAVPVLVEIDPDTFTMDPRWMEAAITPRTRAVIPVHIYGQMADMARIRSIAARLSLPIVEDCAQAHGARFRDRRAGTWGVAGGFSFYPTKNLGAFGDGGMVVTSDASLAERVRMLREYGWRERYVSESPGVNSRLDELQAAILSVKLAHLDADNTRRGQIAARYDEGLSEYAVRIPARHREAVHVFHQYVIQCDERDDLRAFLSAEGIGTLIHYPLAVHQQPAYRGRLRTVPEGLPVTESVCRRILSLPMYPQMEDGQVERVLAAVRRWRQRASANGTR